MGTKKFRTVLDSFFKATKINVQAEAPLLATLASRHRASPSVSLRQTRVAPDPLDPLEAAISCRHVESFLINFFFSEHVPQPLEGGYASAP
jgi:hypothetical protein